MAYRGNQGMGGMGNMQSLMKQAQRVQEQMEAAEKELADTEVLGFSGGGEEGDETVVVYMNAQKEINGIEFGSQLSGMIDLSDEDDVAMLEDLIMAAVNNGYEKAQAMYDEKMAPYKGGLM